MSAQEEELCSSENVEETDQNKDTVGTKLTINTPTTQKGDEKEDVKSQSSQPLAFTLAQGYVSGISSTNRALLYLFLITYISYFYPNLQSSSYMANAKNPLNQYFVKYAWGWTFSAVFLFMILSNYITTGTWLSARTIRSSCRLAVGTIVWYAFARVIFPYIEESTGVCEVSGLLTKRTCYMAGHFWRGFDFSGHCFLLSWNNLFMVEECQGFFKQRKTTEDEGDRKVGKAALQTSKDNSLVLYLEYLSYGLVFLVVLGEIMLLCTSLYFHTLMEKILGTLCGLLSWYLMYKKVYTGAWHPSSQETEKHD